MNDSKCLRCGKPLTDPESIKRGYGPECFRIQIDWLQNRIGFTNTLDEKNIDEKESAASAMENRLLYIRSIVCEGCGYKSLKPISWTESSCTICKLRGNKHIFKL